MPASFDVAFGFVLALILALAIGFPIAAALGSGRGVQSLGISAGLGSACILILCRAVQMWWPLAQAQWWMFVGIAVAAVSLWLRRASRDALARLVVERRMMLAVGVAALLVGVLLTAPILFDNAIQFEGTRNADSFTFTSSASYMLSHSFYGSPDFSALHPVYTISRRYFGEQAGQPRPAAEGLLAWLSALRGVDPMRLYNAVQSAGSALASIAIFSFVPATWSPSSWLERAVVLAIAFLCPTLLHIAINSNFANLWLLPAATVYVALGLAPRAGQPTFAASVICLGALLSGYPELLPFVAVARGLGVAVRCLVDVDVRGMFKEAAWLIAELAAACALLPWAAAAAAHDYLTTLTISGSSHADLHGNMFASLPLAVVVVIALAWSWRRLQPQQGAPDRRLYAAGILVALGLAQTAMVLRGFAYGGFKLSEYFTPLLLGILLMSIPVAGTTCNPRRRVGAWRFAVVVAALMLVFGANAIRRSWKWSLQRRVTPDLVQAGQELKRLSGGLPVRMGASPQPFYYGMWTAYLSSVPIAYDFDQYPQAAGYLSAFLKTQAVNAQWLRIAPLTLNILPRHAAPTRSVARYGRVQITASK